MDIGLILVTTTKTGNVATLARRAEEIGFESLWIPEHPIIPIGPITPFPFAPALPEHYGRWVDPFIALTVAATATTRLKLVTGICLLPERDPIVTAKVVASLDYYSGGRVVLGVGAGWLKEETEAMGTPFRLRWQRLRETVEAMRILWTQTEASYNGKLVQFPAVRCEPKPVQAGGPAILLGGHGQKALERIAKSYDGWCPIVDNLQTYKEEVATVRQLTREAGRNPDTLQLSPFVDPQDGKLSRDEIRAYQEIGVSRIVLFTQQIGSEMADGQAAAWLERLAPIVERAKSV
ncbi:MAG: TIGR03619 family F420-dependent LLM class oxidoreductase [Candidatus Binatia bacterium]